MGPGTMGLEVGENIERDGLSCERRQEGALKVSFSSKDKVEFLTLRGRRGKSKLDSISPSIVFLDPSA